jgi:3-phosphoshikimate 1-carboxyvinyltransferase
VEIEPLVAPFAATVALPGSKSVANRALVCAALAEGSSRLENLPAGDDTVAMVAGLRALGV